MSDGSTTPFDRVLDICPPTDKNMMTFRYHKGRKAYSMNNWDPNWSPMVEQQKVKEVLNNVENLENSNPLRKGPAEMKLVLVGTIAILLLIGVGLLLNFISKKPFLAFLGLFLMICAVLVPAIVRPISGKLAIERLQQRKKNIDKSLAGFNQEYLYGKRITMKSSEFGAYLYLEKAALTKGTEKRPLVCTKGSGQQDIQGYKDIGDDEDIPVAPVRKQTTVKPNQARQLKL